ncbi:MAG: MATE family efflux transporter [Oceanospirillaceae bacterium]|nr:MATE family efflux transporter [Oceanospirillaceae bacterium]MAY01312.1 MATE family efflux transporter [Oceanospirillaceae bacterium]MBL74093.1 MATE family efflux transporter [Idiomarinaceae bacterium]MBS51424.1 MATE family efflux transporter [Oceanospirillaceae bacterium]|tara:strand:+ start:1471 stop:2823 length:1353 start_codon:yes stop_codon:yes gene_type:complete
MRKHSDALIHGHIPTVTLKMALGMLTGFFAITAFNAVDTFFVAQLGSAELAAMTFTFPVVLMIGSLSMGMGMGIISVVSRALGAQDRERAKRMITDGLLLSVIVALVSTTVGISSMEFIFRSLGADGEVLNLVHQYMYTWFFAVPFVVLTMAGNNVIRATGDTLTPSLIMGLTVLVNVILDPLVIFGIGPFPEMGIQGAALATVLARVCALLLAAWILVRRLRLIAFEWLSLNDMLAGWKAILKIGIPAALVQIINPISMAFIVAVLATYGEEVVAGFGAAGRIEMFLIMVPMALSSVMGPFSGQNWGAEKPQRILHAQKFTSMISLIWGVLIFAVLLIFAKPLVALFNDHPQVVEAGSTCLHYVAVGYGFMGTVMIASQTLSAINMPLRSAAMITTRLIILLIPMVLAGSAMGGVKGVYVAILVANILSGIGAYFYLRTGVLKPYIARQ